MKKALLRQPLAAAALMSSVLLGQAVPAFGQTSSLVSVGSDGRLVYRPTAKGDVVPDYSGVGYMNSETELPDLSSMPSSNVITIAAGSGDKAPAIRQAIATLKTRTPVNGFLGVIKFNAGTYEVRSTVTIDAGGIVLRGAGSGTTGTIINYTATTQSDCFVFSGAGGTSVDEDTRRRIQGSYVPYGAKTITLPSGHGYQPDQWVRVDVRYNQAWIDMMRMNSTYLGTEAWQPSGMHYEAERQIKAVSGNTITLDAPIMDPIDSRYAVAEVVRIVSSQRIENCGIEDMRIVSAYPDETSIQHGWKAVVFDNVKNGWARNIFSYYFGYACVSIEDENSIFITVEDCLYSEPKGAYDTGRRYSFNNNGQRALFQNCRAEKGGRHDFVSGSWTPGPSVFYNCVATDSLSDSGPHHRWTTGHLYDRVSSNYAIRVRNRGMQGTGHGWVGAQIMMWNCVDTDAAQESVVQEPPGDSTNWAIGFVGNLTAGDDGEAIGVVESAGTHISAIPSLFMAQLLERLGGANPSPGSVTVTSAQPFYNRPLPSSQSGMFEASFDATPSTTDATIGLCLGNQSAYTGLATIVRFNTTGTIDARNGGAYAAVTSVPYSQGVTYRFRLVVNVPAHTYSAYVTPAGGTERTIATNYAFRTEQATVGSLNTMNIDTNNGSITVGPVTLGPVGPMPVWTHRGPTTFNGSNSVDGTTSSGSTANLTVAFWATPAVLANMGPVDKLPATGTAGWAVKLRSNGDLWLRIGSEATNTTVVVPGVYSASTRVHIAFTFGAGTAQVFVNGARRVSQSGITATSVANTSTLLRLGIPSVAATTNVYRGVLEKVNIYDRVLTAAEITGLYQAP